MFEGEIKVGDEFVWEPELLHAVQAVVVTKIEGGKIWSRPLGDETANDESRFREACVHRPTIAEAAEAAES